MSSWPANSWPASSGQALHIAFTYTPFNQVVLSSVVQRPEFEGAPVWVINTSQADFDLPTAEVLNLGLSGGIATTLLAYRRLGSVISKLRSQGRILSVSAPHPHMLASNALMLDQGEFPVNVYEDGMANYCASENSGSLHRSAAFKPWLGPLLGFRFNNYAGHISGIDQRLMDHGYFMSPELIYRPHRFKSLHRIEPDFVDVNPSAPLTGSVLVLDQDIESIFDADTSALLRRKLIACVDELALDVYFKPHPSRPSTHRPNEFARTPHLVGDIGPAESIAAELRPSHVVSFFSSALKNIGVSHPGTQCISVGAREFDQQRGAELAAVFARLGIEIK